MFLRTGKVCHREFEVKKNNPRVVAVQNNTQPIFKERVI